VAGQLKASREELVIHNPFLFLRGATREIQQPITTGGCGQPSSEATSCCLAVIRKVCVVSSSVHCSVVTFHWLAKENEWFENR
jgi:hypothetical protein